jgi:hypothetical protein
MENLDRLLDHWIAGGIITPAQADRMRADPGPAGVAGRNGPPVVVETLGYLGGVIVLVGLGLVTARFWDSFTVPARIGLAGAVAAVLAIAGVVIPDENPSGVRLRSVVWVASDIALFACLGLLASDRLGYQGDTVLLTAAGGAALAGAAMWSVHRYLPQQATFFVSLVLATGAATGLATDAWLAPSTAVWVVGAGWCGAGLMGVVRPRRGTMVLGAAAGIVGSLAVAGEPWGTVLALGGTAALVAAAVVLRDLVVLAAASIGTLLVLPTVVLHYFPGVLAAALTLVITGLLLVAVAIYTSRRRRDAHAA